MDFMSKDGHYGVVSNTKNPILKGKLQNQASRNSLSPEFQQVGSSLLNFGQISASKGPY